MTCKHEGEHITFIGNDGLWYLKCCNCQALMQLPEINYRWPLPPDYKPRLTIFNEIMKVMHDNALS